MDRDTVMQMAREAQGEERLHGMWSMLVEDLERFAALVAAHEREACAKVCDSSIHETYIEGYTGAIHSARRECAKSIRARGHE